VLSRRPARLIIIKTAQDIQTMAQQRTVFLFDVDNTLLDNVAIVADLMRHLNAESGHDKQQRYGRYFEQLRTEPGYADYLGALQRYRLKNPHDLHILAASHYLIDYHLPNACSPHAREVIQYCARFGEPVILSDGDVVFQPLKIRHSGLIDVVHNRV
jgi:FMN phosphatase YigB (HAD superfamily)